MAIDYVIELNCVPKATFTTDSILERLKGDERAQTIIALFRENGDDRPPSQMGFEFTRSTPEGDEETRVIVVQDLIDAREELDSVAHHCEGCPANRVGKPFGCFGFVHYPISSNGERWLLDSLPVPDEALTWLLLRKGIEEFQYDGASVRPLREASDVYFEERYPMTRRLGEFSVDANQLFEMIFAVGSIYPNHAGLLLLFLHAIERDMEADAIMNITPAPFDVDIRHPFQIRHERSDDDTLYELKEFIASLYLAWKLNVPLVVDA
jgi:hypothetical protein